MMLGDATRHAQTLPMFGPSEMPQPGVGKRRASGKKAESRDPLGAISVYHLTPSGWQRADAPPYPEDRVETVLCEADSREGPGKDIPAFTRLWKSPKHSLSEMGYLHFIFGDSPKRLEPGMRDAYQNGASLKPK